MAIGTEVKVIVTAPPYAPFLDEVAAHPIVSGLRLNTVMPVRGGPGEALKRLSKYDVPLWVDLKGRQLRVVEPAMPPFTTLRVSHRIKVRVPVDAYFNDGREIARIVDVDGDLLILEDGPRRLVGPGESINIIDPSLVIEGNLTSVDESYLREMKQMGMNKIMLSYVENPRDVEDVKRLLPAAEILLKIETQKGLSFVDVHKNTKGGLVAARGDLFVEVKRPHQILQALRKIIIADPHAVAASRILESLAYHPVPENADISDVGFLLSLGYRTFMLGDAVCLRRDSVVEALNLIEAIAEDFL